MATDAESTQRFLDKYSIATEQDAQFGAYGEKDAGGVGWTGFVNPHGRAVNGFFGLIELADGLIPIGDIGNACNFYPVSGDGTLSKIGVFAIAANAVTTPKIAANAVTPPKIATGYRLVGIGDTKPTPPPDGVDLWLETTIGGDAYLYWYNSATPAWELVKGDAIVADGTITTAKLADNAVTNAKMADNAVGTVEIIDDAVTTAKILNSAVTTAKIDNLAVDDTKLAANAVTTAKINALAVDDTKLAANSVIEAKIAANAVTATKIADSNVTTAKIADANVTSAKLASNLTVSLAAEGLVINNKRTLARVSDPSSITSPTNGETVLLADLDLQLIYHDNTMFSGPSAGYYRISPLNITDNYDQSLVSGFPFQTTSHHAYHVSSFSGSSPGGYTQASNELTFPASTYQMLWLPMADLDFTFQLTISGGVFNNGLASYALPVICFYPPATGLYEPGGLAYKFYQSSIDRTDYVLGASTTIGAGATLTAPFTICFERRATTIKLWLDGSLKDTYDERTFSAPPALARNSGTVPAVGIWQDFAGSPANTLKIKNLKLRYPW